MLFLFIFSSLWETKALYKYEDLQKISNRGNTPRDIMLKAVRTVEAGQSINSASQEFEISRMTWARYVK